MAKGGSPSNGVFQLNCHADMLWRIQIAEGGWLYLLVLLEFQSTGTTEEFILRAREAVGIP